ncbi:MAG: adenylyl-sulfate kinase [Anaerolineales bacterium]
MAQGFALWLTGLPGSGKSTLAESIARTLHRRNISCQVLDSNDWRKILTPQPTYSPEERDWFYDVFAHIGAVLTQNKVNVLFVATANRRNYRYRARLRIPRFAEVYVECPLEVCRQRDPKGLYARAAQGLASGVPGFDAPYEAPLAPEIIVNTAELPLDVSARRVVGQLRRLSFSASLAH